MAQELMDQLLEDIKTAMKARQQEKLTALRMLHSELKNISVNAGKELTKKDFDDVLARAVKQRRDAAEGFKQGGRDEQAAKELREIEFFAKYLPQQLSAEEISQLAAECIKQSGALEKKDMGKVMQLLMPKVKGRADGKMVNQVVTGLLAPK